MTRRAVQLAGIGLLLIGWLLTTLATGLLADVGIALAFGGILVVVAARLADL